VILVAEAAQRFFPGSRRRQALIDEVLDPQVEMKLQLVVHVPLVLPDRQPQREPESATGNHGSASCEPHP